MFFWICLDLHFLYSQALSSYHMSEPHMPCIAISRTRLGDELLNGYRRVCQCVCRDIKKQNLSTVISKQYKSVVQKKPSEPQNMPMGMKGIFSNAQITSIYSVRVFKDRENCQISNCPMVLELTMCDIHHCQEKQKNKDDILSFFLVNELKKNQ